MEYRVERDWTTIAGLRAVAVQSMYGHRCGYVGVPPGHALYGVDYMANIPGAEQLAEACKATPVGERGIVPMVCAAVNGIQPSIQDLFDVHGSVTFTDRFSPKHVQSDNWFIGFDCSHYGDSPDVQDLQYVEAECESLAKQIVEMFPLLPKEDTNA